MSVALASRGDDERTERGNRIPIQLVGVTVGMQDIQPDGIGGSTFRARHQDGAQVDIGAATLTDNHVLQRIRLFRPRK